MPGDHTFREILDQPRAWQRVYEQVGVQLEEIDLSAVNALVFTGCGSSYHLAEAAAHVFSQVTGKLCRALPASELFLHPHQAWRKGDSLALIALSRTGTTSEVLRAVELFKGFRAHGDLTGPLVALTCQEDSPLAKACDRAVIIPSHEESIVMTQAFTATLLALLIWAAGHAPEHWALAGLSALDGPLQAVLQKDPLLKELASYQEVTRFVFLGSGVLHAIASEGALKMQEMALSPSIEAWHSLEIRHGRQSTIGRDTLVVLLVSREAAELEADLIAELKRFGARTLVLVGDEEERFAPHADYLCRVGSYPDAARALLYTPHLQLLAYHRAILANSNPDRPRNLSRSVIL